MKIATVLLWVGPRTGIEREFYSAIDLVIYEAKINMVDLPSIHVPTAFAAAMLTFGGNWIKDAYYRRRDDITQEKREKIRWCEETIQLCEEIETTYSLVRYAVDFHETPLSEQYDFDVKEVVQENTDKGVELETEELELVLGELEANAKGDLTELMLEKVVSDIADHYIAVRENFARKPREIDSDFEEEASDLASNLVGIQVEIEAGLKTPDIDGRDLSDTASTIKSKCRDEIHRLE